MSKTVFDFTDEEMAQRLPVWTVLTDIFVNVDQTKEEFKMDTNYIALKLSKLGLSIQSLEEILKDEIGPIFACNFSIFMSFPETQGWSAEDVEVIMKNHRAQKNTLDGLWHKLFKKNPFKNVTVAKRWAAIKKRLKEMGTPELSNPQLDE